MTRSIYAALIVAVALAFGGGTASAAGVPALNYWKAGVREDAIQWCEVHSYIGGQKLYGCIYNAPSCSWEGPPYPANRGRCAMAWTMWPRSPSRPPFYCVGRADYVDTRNVTAFQVTCSPLTYI